MIGRCFWRCGIGNACRHYFESQSLDGLRLKKCHCLLPPFSRYIAIGLIGDCSTIYSLAWDLLSVERQQAKTLVVSLVVTGPAEADDLLPVLEIDVRSQLQNGVIQDVAIAFGRIWTEVVRQDYVGVAGPG